MYAVLGNQQACVEVRPTFAGLDALPQVLLRNSSDASLADSSARTALHWAVHHGHLSCTKWALAIHLRSLLGKSQAPLDWRVGDQGGVTVLHLAQRHKSPKLLKVEGCGPTTCRCW